MRAAHDGGRLFQCEKTLEYADSRLQKSVI